MGIGRCGSPAPRPRGTATPAARPARPTATSGSTPTAARSCWGTRGCRRVVWNGWRSSNSCGRSRPASASPAPWSRTPRLASTPAPITMPSLHAGAHVRPEGCETMDKHDKADKPAEHARRSGPTRHIFITGGVVSSLGKGITSASIGRLLINMGYRVRIQKLDPYLNVDPGTMNPFQHGEVFVTRDGAETDLDLGHYERFLNQPCTRHSTYTSGRIYQAVIQKEREGKYNGGTVQVVPHITNEIKDAIRSLVADDVDVIIHEIGGTVGDIEGLPFMEAVRQFAHEVGREYCAFVHLAYIPYIKAAGEIKTKPAQHSVQKLREIGIIPDFLVCRAERGLTKDVKDKLALFCNVGQKSVIELPTSRPRSTRCRRGCSSRRCTP